MSDPRPDLEDQQKADLADEKKQADASTSGSDSGSGSGSDGTGAAEATIVDTNLDEYLNSQQYADDHLGNYAKIVNPDGTPAIDSTDTEAQDVQDAKEVAEAEAWKDKLSDADKARLDPGLSNVDYADLFAAAKNDDPTAKALVGDITDGVPLVEVERQVQLGVADPADVHAAVSGRIADAEQDLAKALGGDRYAWFKYNVEVNGHTPTSDEMRAFDAAGGPSLSAAERHFQMLGIDTRPQEMLDRLNGLLGDVDKAGKG